MTTTHIAGVPIGFLHPSWTVQRCAVCGEKIVDTRTGPARTFGVGFLVRAAGGRFEDAGELRAGALPEDLCVPLVEV